MQEPKELLVLLLVVPINFVKVERAHSTVLLVGALKLRGIQIRVKPIPKAPSRA